MHTELSVAVRRLLKSPGFTVVSILMLALGIGMSTATFSVTNSVLLSSMPFKEPERLMRLFSTSSLSSTMDHSPGNFLDIRAADTPFSSMAAYVPENYNVSQKGQPPVLEFGLQVTANFLTTLGIQPFLGRGFAPDEDQPGKGAVVILTDSFWRHQYGADPAIIGKTLRVQTDDLTVIGVLPPSFDKTVIWYTCGFIKPLTVWAPWITQRDSKWVSLFGRLKPGVTAAAADVQLATLAARLDHDYAADNGLDGLRVTPLASSDVGDGSRRLYWLVVWLGVLVLLIACSNLASVQLARAFGRSHEFAVRAALGARRSNLVAPLLLESVLLTAAGGGLGVLLASWANRLISHFFTGSEIPIDGRVLLFTSMACLLTALTFGFAPSWLASRVSTSDALKENSRGSTSSGLQRRLKFALIISQLAFALILVSAALSFGIGVRKFLKRDMGWKPASLVEGVLNIPYDIYKADLKNPVIVQRVTEGLSRIPGVTRVSLASSVPLYGDVGEKKIIVEGAPPSPKGQEHVAYTTAIDSGFFTTLKIPFREGRTVPETFKEGDHRTIVINQSMAKRYWPAQSALGKRVRFTDKTEWSEVIGVVGDISTATNFNSPETRLQIYRPLQEDPTIWYNFVLTSSLPADTLIQPIRKAIADANPDLMVEGLGGVEEQLKSNLSGNNLIIITLCSFACIGLLIAIIGLYGVISQLTMQRSREIGIRMALGADYAKVVRMILAQGGILILCGVVFGLIGAYAVSVIYRQTMPELQLPNLGLQIGVTVLLCASGFAACYLPARRAGRINPVSALKLE